MTKVFGRSLKERLSKKYLDWAELLPKFQGGPIYKLQMIRAHQRKISIKYKQKRCKPDNSRIILSKLCIVTTYQLEDFGLMHRAIERMFPKNKKVSKFLNDLKKDESSIYGSSWSDIGFITKEKKIRFRDEQYVDELPRYVEQVSVSYHRIMPSLACLSFYFYIDDEFNEILANDQKREYLSIVLFNSINPFRISRTGYSIKVGTNNSREIVRTKILNLYKCTSDWIEKEAKSTEFASCTKSVVEYYAISGCPSDPNQLREWVDTNCDWLGDYGISVNKYDSYRSSNMIYCTSSYPSNETQVHNLVLLDDGNSKEWYIDFKLSSISVNASIFSVIDYIKKSFEKYRWLGFLQLANLDARVLKNSVNASRLKQLGVILNRIIHEFGESKTWIVFSFDDVADLKTSDVNEELSLGECVIRDAEFRLNYLRKSFEVIDVGFTGYLELQNIFAMYKLQRWIFILSVVVTLSTIVGIASNFDDILVMYNKIHGSFNDIINKAVSMLAYLL